MLPPGKVTGTLERTVFAEGCIVNASRLEKCVVGIRSRIGHGTTMVNTYMMGNDYFETIADINVAQVKGIPPLGVGNRCYIKNAIIDKNCRIGDDVRINGGTHLENTDHSLYTIKDGIVVVKKGAILPNGYVI
jgi:glucose-1-phosphate adenylyltransferase